MTKISDKLFKQHVLENTLTPCQDSPQLLAYIILLQKYPKLTYWSMDGYSCDALADYDKNYGRACKYPEKYKDGGCK